MNALLMIFAGAFGLAIGSFVNVVAYRVPVGKSLLTPSSCPTCGAPIRAWQNIPVLSWLLLRGRCAACRRTISARYPLVEAATGTLFVLLAWYVPHVLALPTAPAILVWAAFAWFAAVSCALLLIDLDTRRLPNVIVLPSYVVALVLFGIACLLGADWGTLLRAVVGMAVMYSAYAVIRLIRPDGMGGGDVKLAGVAGLYLGWLGWSSLVVGWLAAFLLGGVFGIVLIASGQARRNTAVPFGPWLLVGAWIGIWFGDGIGHSYLALTGLA
jgi:leader peptidase (prepilin peptidase) / N-methyltransferase